MEKIKILIVDDHEMVRVGLRLILTKFKQFEVIAEAADGKEFLRLLNSVVPDVVFMDIRMPKMNGLEATGEAVRLYPNIRIIALSMDDDEPTINSMIQAGAKGFVMKKGGSEELRLAVETVVNDGNYFSQDVMKILMKKIVAPKIEHTINLNPREMEVLKLLCQGKSSQEIADSLFVNYRTVEKYRANLLEKTNSKNSIQIVLFAMKHNLVQF